MITKIRFSATFIMLIIFSLFALPQDENLESLVDLRAGFREVHKKVSPTVVTIYCRVQTTFIGNTGDTETVSRVVSGSGVIMDEHGFIITNDHVVANADEVWIRFCGSEVNHPAVILETDPQTDLAVLRLMEDGTYPFAPMGSAEDVLVGDLAIAFGAPYGLSSTMTVGVISATGRSISHGRFEYHDLLQTDASINQGNSGGPLVNVYGEVIGINFMIFSPGEAGGSIGIGFAIPMNDYVKRIIATLATGEQFTRGKLGVTVRALTDNELSKLDLSGGSFVIGVVQDSAAQRAGILPNDIIIKFADIEVLKTAQLVRLIEQYRVGEEVAIEVLRNNNKVILKAII